MWDCHALKGSQWHINYKLSKGNFLAHDIDLNKPIIEQIFQKIQSKNNENYYDDLISRLKASKAEKILKQLIVNRKKYYYSEKLVEEGDPKILSDNDFGTIFVKKIE